MTSRGYARWIRADVHVHTPFDKTKSFGVDTDSAMKRLREGDESSIRVIASRYYEACRNADLDLVGVTDHNACSGYHILKPYLHELNQAGSASGNDPIRFLPGVEVTVGSERPVHILLLFEETASQTDVEGCIRNVFGIREPFDPATGLPVTANRTVPDFLAAVREYCQPPTVERHLKYLVIPAHVSGDSGIVRAVRGSVRRLVIQHQDWNGFQTAGPISDESHEFREMLAEWTATRLGRDWTSLDADGRRKFRDAVYWPLVQASDPARFEDIGATFTWLKMEEPSLEGLRLALLDPGSRLRSAADGCPACEYPHITTLRVQNTVLFDDLSLHLSPQLNTFIGGRGTGKTSILEYIRHCLDRARPEDFVGGTDTVRSDLESLLGTRASRATERGGTLLDDYRITLGIQVAGSEYEIQRDRAGLRVSKDGALVDAAEIDVRALVEPVIMSQRQMAAIARDPKAQRLVLDSLVSPGVRRECADARRDACSDLEDAQRDRDRLLDKIAELAAERTRLLQLDGNIKALKAPGCESTLAQQERTAAAESWLDKAEALLKAVSEDIRELADAVTRKSETLPALDCDDGSWLASTRDQVLQAMRQVPVALLAASEPAHGAATALHDDREAKWKPEADRTRDAYEKLVGELSEQGIDIGKRSELSDRRREAQEGVDSLAREARTLDDKVKAVADARDRLVAAARKMTVARKDVVDALASQQTDILVDVSEMLDRQGLLDQRESWFARTGMQSRDWEPVVDYVMATQPVADSLQEVVRAMRLDREQAASEADTLDEDSSELVALLGKGVLTGHYFAAMAQVTSEALNHIERYVPDDSVDTRFRDNDGAMKSLEHASLGQKSTAILALLLTSGTEPLVIDQPEDDIDNRYVYDVVVELLRQRKFERQIVVASHNANIPVNGDAELIGVLGVESGIGQLRDCGSIDNPAIKNLVNDVMEGSAEAFALRRERYGF